MAPAGRGVAVLVGLAIGLAALVGAAAGSPSSATAQPGLVAHSVARSPAAALAYWTPARMRAARPPAGLGERSPGGSAIGGDRGAPAFVSPAGPGGPGGGLRAGAPGAVAGASAIDPGEESASPNRLHGRVFFSSGGADYSCSGTAVSSPGRSLVVSAGHCAWDGREWAANWLFVPGYRDGRAPFGRWPATRLRAPAPWVAAENISFDVSAATVARNGDGRALQDVVGARGIGFNQHRDQLYTSYGYPAEPPFDGNSLWACRSPYGGDDEQTDSPRTMRIDCDMTGGASGGGWVARGLLLSVNSYCTGLILVCLDSTSLYGPYFGDAVKQLYLGARGRATRCGGAQVTQLGTAGGDSLAGAGGRDVISLGGGEDSGAGRGGNDILCGGRGDDLLRGGPGFDLCLGGAGRDRTPGCEATRRGRPRD